MSHRDLALAFHRVDRRIYELSGLRTGSLRDQMMRAVLVVERLFDEKLIGANAPLLIVGAGAAGMCASWTASELGVPSLILERSTSLLTTQASVPTRIVDPTEYDWPHSHWRDGVFPFRQDDQPLPISFARNSASLLAWEWQHDFMIWRSTLVRNSGGQYGSIDIQFECEARRITSSVGVECFDISSGPPRSIGIIEWDAAGVHVRGEMATKYAQRFGAALSCVGFGIENVSVATTDGGMYHGPFFWAEDRFADKDLGLKGVGGRLDVLVSGGGDGAQQDIQRLLTRRCGKDLVEEIEKICPDFLSVVDKASVALADDEGRRSHAWSNPYRLPMSSLSRWHKAFAVQAERVWSSFTAHQQRDLLDNILRESVAIHLTWLVGASAPSFSFGINRVLTHLVLRMHEAQTGRSFQTAEPPTKWRGEKPVIVFGQRLAEVQPDGHTCGDFNRCYGKAHVVYCVAEGNPVEELGKFDIVVIRHGMKGGSIFGDPPVPEQLTPLAFPE